MDKSLQQGFQLGEWIIRPLQGAFVGADETIHVEPKVMEVLAALAERPGEVVERQTLVSRFWPDVAAADDALNRCISALRHSLGDHREHPRYIQTIPKIGYRLVEPIGPVAAIPGQEQPRRKTPTHRRPAVSPGPRTPDHADAVTSEASFFDELKRRKVIRVAVVYAVVAWLVIQIAETTFPAVGLPTWTITLVIVLAVLGFLITLVITWALELTPEGVVIDSGVSKGLHRGEKDTGRRFDFVIMGALVLALGVLSYNLLVGPPETPPSTIKPNSIAVIPFENLSDDSKDDYLSDGISEDIRTRLTEVQQLDVAARSSSRSFRGTDIDIQTVASRLSVANVLEGTFRRAGNEIRITAQLVDANTGFHKWAQTYDRSLADIFAVQDDIARSVVEELKLMLSPDSAAQIARRPTESIDAYTFYLQAISFAERSDQEATLDHAIGLFNRALDHDPQFALAYAGLCDTYIEKYRITRTPDLVESARKACLSALSLDDTRSEVHASQGEFFLVTGQWDDALGAFNRAISTNPNKITAYTGLARAYQGLNRLDEAEETYRRIVELRPGNWDANTQLGNFFFNHGRYAEAAESYQQVTQLNPDNATGFNNLGAAYMMMGEFQNAAGAFEESVNLSPASYGYTNLGTMYYYLGSFDDAVQMYQRALLFTARDHRLWGNLGDAYRHMQGEEELSRAAYSQAIQYAEEGLEINPLDPMNLAILGYYYVSVGQNDLAAEKLELAQRHGPRDPYVHYYGSLINIGLGNIEEAVDELEKTIELGYPIVLVADAPEFAPLKENQRFVVLVSPGG